MRFTVRALDVFEREVRFRLPFAFGEATIDAAPQVFVRAEIELENGKGAVGAAAELLAARWFEKDPSVADGDVLGQLRASVGLARSSYLSGEANTAFGHAMDHYAPQIAMAALQGMGSLVACLGPALVDRALLDALGRALGLGFFDLVRKNVPGISAPGWQADLMAFDMEEYVYGLEPRRDIAVRHTVGLSDPLTAGEAPAAPADGLPATLEQAIERYGHRWFKLKLSGNGNADRERLAAVAAVLERLPEYRTTLDGNEQFESADAVHAFWRAVKADARLKRLASSVAYIEQPVRRQSALSEDFSELAEDVAVIIDESDDSLEAFPLARRRGYTGVSSKGCKGLYKAVLNSARCTLWNREEGSSRYFISGEDLTTQAGLGLQQDLALAALLGLAHVERNGHHYVDGMAGLPEAEQAAFLEAHPDLYERSHGAVRLRIVDGKVSLGSLAVPGYASGAHPDFGSMRALEV